MIETRSPFADLPHWKTFSPGSWLLTDDSTPDDAPHRFCGAHDIPGAICIHGHPLLRLFSLATSDPALGLGDLGIPFVHLLCCWRCDATTVDYLLTPDGGVDVFAAERRAAWLKSLEQRGIDVAAHVARMDSRATDYPYEEYPFAFPGRPVRLQPLTATEQEELLDRELNGSSAARRLRARHQVGGLPYLAQGSDFVPTCAGCGEKTIFFASVADDCTDPRGFTGNSGVQMVYFLCPGCRRVSGFNVCD
jgi:hypothetical protein